MKISKKTKMMTAIGAVIFAVYNIIFWLLCGFTGHRATFWISWGFMMVSFCALAVSYALLGQRRLLLRDWLFGFPIVKHSTIYILAEFLLSTVFVILEKKISWQLAFSVQILIFAVYLVFAISCFLAKATIDDVHTRVADKTRFIKLLRADVEMLVEKCTDPGLKPKLGALAEAVRYSDPMSDESLFELEKELALTVSNCDQAITDARYEEAAQLCEKASLLLKERNKKCKALK